MNRNATPRVGEAVLVFNGPVCPSCLCVPAPTGPWDGRWLRGTVWEVDTRSGYMVVAYDYSTRSGYYWRHVGTYRRFVRRMRLWSNEWTHCRLPKPRSLEDYADPDADSTVHMMEHLPDCLQKCCSRSCRARRHNRTIESTDDAIAVGDECEPWDWEEELEERTPAKLPTKSRNRRNHRTGFGADKLMQPSTSSPSESPSIPTTPATSATESEPPSETETGAAVDNGTDGAQYFGVIDTAESTETATEMRRIGSVWGAISESKRRQVIALLEVLHMGLSQDCQCARQLREIEC